MYARYLVLGSCLPPMQASILQLLQLQQQHQYHHVNSFNVPQTYFCLLTYISAHARYLAYVTFDESVTRTYSYFPSLFLLLDALYLDSHFHSFTCNNYLNFVSLDGLVNLAIIIYFSGLVFSLD